MSHPLSRRAFLAGAAGAPFVAAFGCGGGGGLAVSRTSAVRSWTNIVHNAVKAVRPYPPAVARAHAIVATAMYDAWAAYDAIAVGTQLGGTLRRPPLERTDANKAKAISFAAYRALVDLFPTQQPAIDQEMARQGYDKNDISTNTSTPSGIGNTVANTLLAFRHNDGSNQANGYVDYVPNPQGWPLYTSRNDPDHINDPDEWQPLRVSNGSGGFVAQKYAGPFWAGVVTFALTSGHQ